MINWAVNGSVFKKKYPTEYKLWKITQLLNYGLDGEKIDILEIKNNWGKIKQRVDQKTKVYMEYILWGKQPFSTKTKKNSSNLS